MAKFNQQGQVVNGEQVNINKYPDWLIEMSRQMNAQTSRSTSHPFWQVRHKDYLVTEEGYSESHWELWGEEDEVLPSYSSKEDFDNSEALQEFYQKNEGWCDDWVDSQVDDENIDVDEAFEEFKGTRDEWEDDKNFYLFSENFDFVAFKDSWEDWPEGYKIIHLQEIEKTVWTGLSESAANEFIQRQQHNYPKLYTYVESAYWSPEFSRLMDWIKGLSK